MRDVSRRYRCPAQLETQVTSSRVGRAKEVADITTLHGLKHGLPLISLDALAKVADILTLRGLKHTLKKELVDRYGRRYFDSAQLETPRL